MKRSKNLTADNCKDRIDKIKGVKGAWTPEEDAALLKGYSKFQRNWALIAKKIPGRTGKQVRERYVNYLEKKQNLQSETFSSKQDDLIIRYFNQYPHDWNKITTFI